VTDLELSEESEPTLIVNQSSLTLFEIVHEGINFWHQTPQIWTMYSQSRVPIRHEEMSINLLSPLDKRESYSQDIEVTNSLLVRV